MTAPTYPDYKSTHIHWLERIPRHWELKPLKYCIIRLGSGGTPETKEPEYWADEEDDGAVPWVAIGDMSNTQIVLNTQKRLTQKGLNSKGLEVFRAGSLLYSIYASLGKVATLGVDAAFNQAILAIEPNPQSTTQEFLGYWLRNLEAHLDYYASSNTQANLNAAKVLSYPVAVPSHEEQLAIVSFLDRETAKIDALIAEQQRLIELLQEKRQAVISHAVTKGLNPNAPMKDSGVEWLGEVPEHWGTGKIKHYFRTTSGSTPNSDKPQLYYTTEEDEQGTPWIRTTDIDNGEVKSAVVFITPRALEDTACKALPVNTVLVALYGGGGTVGKNGILKIEAAVNQALCGILPSPKALPEYVLKYIQFLRPFWMERAVSARKAGNISQELVGDTAFPIPPLQEQAEILRAIEENLEELDELAKHSSESLVLLEERRSALISAAVTGQIDVRGLVPEASEQ